MLLLMTPFTIAVISTGQKYDTLYTRGQNYILVEKRDTVQELKEINAKADTILNDLRLIKEKLQIETKKDTIQ